MRRITPVDATNLSVGKIREYGNKISSIEQNDA